MLITGSSFLVACCGALGFQTFQWGRGNLVSTEFLSLLWFLSSAMAAAGAFTSATVYEASRWLGPGWLQPQPHPAITIEQTRADDWPVWQWDQLARACLSEILRPGAGLAVTVNVASDDNQ